MCSVMEPLWNVTETLQKVMERHGSITEPLRSVTGITDALRKRYGSVTERYGSVTGRYGTFRIIGDICCIGGSH